MILIVIYLMTYAEVQPIALSIMTSIITGGFVLVFIEIGNRKNRESDRYNAIMHPFMHKLSAYFRYVNWCRLEYPKDMDGNEKMFKKLIDEMARYGASLVMSGGDLPFDRFTAQQLYEIALDINNIWYYHDKMHPCRLNWNGATSYDGTDYVAKELKEINPVYLFEKQDVTLLAKVSGEFYIDIYQVIENELFRYEAYLRQYNRQTIWVSVFFSFVLMVLCLMLFMHFSILFLQIASSAIVLMLVFSLLMLAVDVKVWVKWDLKRVKHRKTRQ